MSDEANHSGVECGDETMTAPDADESLREPSPDTVYKQSGVIRRPHSTVYASAVDWWIAVLLMAGPLLCALLTVILLRDGRGEEALYCLLTAAGTLIVTGIFTVPCRYTILDDSLTIRCGILFYRVPLDKIREIETSRSWLSGPALSLRRVKISTASKFYLVSPQDRESFMQELQKAVAKKQG